GRLLVFAVWNEVKLKLSPTELPTDLDPAQRPLFEVFLAYALAGFRRALRRGVPHAYVSVAEERAGLRGRLNLAQQVRQLPSRAHLLHVTYDEYRPDRPETRLVRSSLERIARLSAAESTRRLARKTLQVLDGVPPSRDIRADLGAWRLERGNTHFAPLESLVRLILFDLNPLTGGGSVRSVSVLFDMNKVYESYVAWLLRRDHPDWVIRTQVRGQALGTLHGQPVFRLRPDLHLTLPSGEVVIADTKWKRLENAPHRAYGVSQADAYQMLAYSATFHPAGLPGPQHLWLIYPRLPGFPEMREPIRLGGAVERHLHIVTLPLEGAASEVEWPVMPSFGFGT
ncbi:McrC family protein, partial [Deinococcus piscis]|uniref:McrC family protein n=1 Tax=Deinococcus piscis TaxID=394230 RepID=UPI0016732CC6